MEAIHNAKLNGFQIIPLKGKLVNQQYLAAMFWVLTITNRSKKKLPFSSFDMKDSYDNSDE